MHTATDTGSVLPVSEIGKLIQAYQDKHGTSDRALALRVGVTATLVGRWKKGLFVELPKPEKIRNLAALIGPRPTEEEILDAFLADTGYRREDVMGHADSSAPNQTPEVRPAEQPTIAREGEKAHGTVTKLSDGRSTFDDSEPRVAKKRPPRERSD